MSSTYEDELKKMCRVSDMMITCHARRRDRLNRYALITDTVLLTLSSIITAFTFASEEVKAIINISPWSGDIYLGILGVALFAASIIQLKVDWKAGGAAHGVAAQSYFRIKKHLSALLIDPSLINETQFKEAKEQYTTVGEYSIPIPDDEFLSLKRYHKVKIVISKYLDTHPGASPFLVRLKLWVRDNLKGI